MKNKSLKDERATAVLARYSLEFLQLAVLDRRLDQIDDEIECYEELIKLLEAAAAPLLRERADLRKRVEAQGKGGES